MPEAEVKCYYCGKPAHRTGPGGWGICKKCDDKLDAADKRILIDVQGGVVQEVFATPGLGVRIYKIDWDNIKEGGPNVSPWVEYDPAEIDLDEFRKKLKKAEQAHADIWVCKHCGGDLTGHDEDMCPDKVWKDDSVQFPRLLAEIYALGLTEAQVVMLGKSMDLEPEQIQELMARAEAQFEKDKERIAGKPERKPEDAASGD